MQCKGEGKGKGREAARAGRVSDGPMVAVTRKATGQVHILWAPFSASDSYLVRTTDINSLLHSSCFSAGSEYAAPVSGGGRRCSVVVVGSRAYHGQASPGQLSTVRVVRPSSLLAMGGLSIARENSQNSSSRYFASLPPRTLKLHPWGPKLLSTWSEGVSTLVDSMVARVRATRFPVCPRQAGLLS
ncbi:hypothetical protein GY45DRAFT_333080 [Cubamyces sp. BRFM 1775]|nr:hypothetical protein GY45DRAFT_333080 [Cubamyces sp. BRFM 1775]